MPIRSVRCRNTVRMRGHFVSKSHLYVAFFQSRQNAVGVILAVGEGVGRGVSEACCSWPIRLLSFYPNERYARKYRQVCCIVCHLLNELTFSIDSSNSVARLTADQEGQHNSCVGPRILFYKSAMRLKSFS
jgi:hypothetical protein